MNADWHRANPMPKNPTEAQRIAWHKAHAIACACRTIPERLLARIRAIETEGEAEPRQD